MKQKATATALVRECAERGIKIATAESCTGGLIAKTLTDVAGSSAVFAGGAVTYTNEVKIALLGVDPEMIARESEVSHACAKEMAEGVRIRLGVDLAVSTTGYAGPTGGTEADPVGTVYLGVSTSDGVYSERFCAPAGLTRAGVRRAATERAIALLLEFAQKQYRT